MDQFGAHLIATEHRRELADEAEQSRLAKAARDSLEDEWILSTTARHRTPAHRPATA